MKSKKWATIKNAKIISYSDSSSEKELTEKEIPLTSNEYKIIQAVKGDLKLAELIVKELQQRVQAVEESPANQV